MKAFFTRISLPVLFLLLFTHFLQAQGWQYSQHLSVAANSAQPRGITLDSDTNLYLTAFYRPTATLIGPHGSRTYANAGNQDILLAKLSSSGDTIWTQRIYGTQSDYPREVAIDNSNNPYITGIYRQSALTIQDQILPNPRTERPTDLGYDIFLAQYTSNGGNVFARRVAWGPLDDEVDKIAVDASNNVYMTGTFYDSLFFEGDTLTTPTPADKHIFIAKFKPNGDFTWAKALPQDTTTGDLLDIVVHNYNEIYVSGFFIGSLDFDGTILTSQGKKEDIVLAKMDSAGTFEWVRQAGSVNTADRANGLTTDAEGSVYITGYFTGTADFSGTQVVSAGATDMFLAKYNNSGALQWVSRNGAAGTDIAYGAKIRENLLQTTGNFAGTVSFNNKTLTTGDTTNRNAGFFVYDLNGNPITAQDVPDKGIRNNTERYEDRGEYIEFDPAGNTYIAGWFRSDSLFLGKDTLLNGNLVSNAFNLFLAKYQNPFSATFSQTGNLACNGQPTGSLVVTTYFGTAPYQYQWSPNVSTFTDSLASNLAAGTYWVKVKDALGDSVQISTTLTQPTAIVITTDSTNIACHDSLTGTLSASATGGTGTLTYAWTGGNALAGNQPNQTGLQAAKYMLTVTDQNSCTANDSVTLTQPEALTFGSVTTVTESPYLAFNGKIFLSPQGGTPAYSFQWDSLGIMLPGETADSLVNRTEGYYTVTLTDANLCVVDTTILIPGETFRVDLQALNNVLCFGQSNAQARARIVSGNKGNAVSYSFTDNLLNPLIPLNDSTIASLAIGWYYVTATETEGDLRTATDSLRITQPDSLELTLSTDTIACFGNSTGFINLLVDGGTPGYDFLWSDGQITQSATGMKAGWHQVLVTDQNACQTIDSIEIIQRDSIAITISEIETVSCYGSANGILQANVTGGLSPYAYDWNPGLQDQAQMLYIPAGDYSVSITDQLGCIQTASYTLGQPSMLFILSADSNDVSCYDSEDGSLSVTMAGGTEPYSYNWGGSLPDTNFLENLAALTYSLVVSDARGCTNDSLQATIHQPITALVLSEQITSHANNLCYGDAEGIIELLATGGWSAYEFSIDSVNWQSATSFGNLTAAQYRAFVRDAQGCTEEIGIEITEAPELLISSESVDGRSIEVLATGGTPPLEYWLNGIGTPQDTGLFNNLPNGTYFVEVNDSNDCGPVRTSDLVVDGSSTDYQTLENVIAYPNPSKGIVILNLSERFENQFTIEVFNLNGSRVWVREYVGLSGLEKLIELNFTGLSAGVYLMKVNHKPLSNMLVLE